MLLGRLTAAAVSTTRSGLAAVADVTGTAPSRRSWSGSGRAWVEVRGLDGPGGDDVAAAVLDTVRELDGVQWAELNRTLSRVVVSVAPAGPSVEELSAAINGVERGHGILATAHAGEAADLPGDSAVLTGRALAVGADAVGLAAAVAGRALRLPRVPGSLTAAVALVDTQPRLRRVVEGKLGPEAADVALAVTSAVAQTLAQGPASLAVDLSLRAALLAESQAGRRAWQRQEPALSAAPAPKEPFPHVQRPRPRPSGPIENYADAAALAGLGAAAVVGTVTGSPVRAGDAVLVAAARATRTAREGFASTLGRLLADRDGVLVLRPGALRHLDRVDALVIDPAVLLTERLTVSEVQGVEGDLRTRVWTAAQQDVTDGWLAPGWHPSGSLSPAHAGSGLPEDAQLLVTTIADPLAAAVLTAARTARVQLVSLDVADLGELRAVFDSLDGCASTTDAGLLAATQALQAEGRTVAVLAVDAPFALAAADVAMAVTRDGAAPGWTADLLLPDLAAAWRVVTAFPQARATSRRGVELSAGGSLLGALLMLPGVRGRGSGPVVAGAAVGLMTGRSAALRVMNAKVPTPAPVIDWHALPIEQALAALPAPNAHPAALAASTAQHPSWITAVPRLIGPAGHPVVLVTGRLIGAFRAELADPLTPILATGAAASAVLGSPIDAVLVGSVVLGNALLSAAQRLRAERLLSRLLAGQDTPARLMLSSTEPGSTDPGGSDPGYAAVPAEAVKVGDRIEIRAGEVVPADARILTAANVEVDESSLTGESLPASKEVAPTPGAPLAERACMLFEGTLLHTGTATAVVTAVGAATEAGRASALAPGRPHQVGLQTQLGRLTSKVLPVTLSGGAAVTLLALARGAGIRQAVTSGVSISVAAVPEGLPLVATLAQQAAARRLTRRGVLVRSPRAVEALGRVDTVCFDKTGTLSENRLRVIAAHPQPGHDRQTLLACAALACPEPVPDRPIQHATDSAILHAAGAPRGRDADLPFRPGRPFAAGLSGTELAVKGAPELVLAASNAPPEISAAAHAMAAGGLRVIAVARRTLTARQAAAAATDDDKIAAHCQNKLHLVGLLGLADAPRADALDLLPQLTARGVGVRVITGDHPLTARAIVAELGHVVTEDQVITGAEWARLSHPQQQRAAERVAIFARMSPEQKVQVVQVLESAGHVCAMVGDGANDAAAIRAASVGVGVASHGSDPARGAADVVLTDGRVGALLDALEEGDRLWRQVQAAVSLLLGGNAGEVAFTLIGTGVSGRAPLNARQLLLVNMLTDALPAAAVAISAPRHTSANPTARGMNETQLWQTVALRGAATTIGATSAWTMAKLTGRARRASTVGLIALVGTQLGQTLIDSRSPLVLITAGGSMVTLAAVVNTPGVSQLLGCTPLGPLGWTQALGAAAAATLAAAVTPNALLSLAHRPTTPPEQGITPQPGPHPNASATNTAAAPAGSETGRPRPSPGRSAARPSRTRTAPST